MTSAKANTSDRPPIEMNFGDHLDELRRRVIFSTVGIVIACILTLYYGKNLVGWLQHPLGQVLRHEGLPAQTYGFKVTTGFAIYIKVSLIAGLIVAGPWVLYQAWRFIEAGLYASERKIVIWLMPFSAVFSTLGVLFAYYVMLPICLIFLIGFSTSFPPAGDSNNLIVDNLSTPIRELSGIGLNETHPSDSPPPTTTQPSATPPLANIATVPMIDNDPIAPIEGQIWINQHLGELRIFYNRKMRTMPLAANSMMSPMIEIGWYISFVSLLILGIVIGFQLPLVMLIGGWSRLVDPDWLRPYRRYAILITLIIGALLTPADPISMIVLAVPLYLLFELGLILMAVGYQRNAPQSAPPNPQASPNPNDSDISDHPENEDDKA